ncbi:hypothetical protein CS542_02470 [Pedobacter sp. IW39]|nr:hypothetical protein CS542_02470 [Pedobacter sp. IW39]
MDLKPAFPYLIWYPEILIKTLPQIVDIVVQIYYQVVQETINVESPPNNKLRWEKQQPLMQV